MLISTCALREEGDAKTTAGHGRRHKFLSTPSARRATARLWLMQPSWTNFYPRPPRGGRRGSAGDHHPLRNFYPRPPRGGRRCGAACFHLPDMISIHALREEGDPLPCCRGFMLPDFYPRPPRGGRRARWNPLVLIPVFLSTPSARRATCPLEPACADTCISIHALREEGDRNRCFRADRSADFYPRPPRGGRPDQHGERLRRTTNFYPHPPRGGRLTMCGIR